MTDMSDRRRVWAYIHRVGDDPENMTLVAKAWAPYRPGIKEYNFNFPSSPALAKERYVVLIHNKHEPRAALERTK